MTYEVRPVASAKTLGKVASKSFADHLGRPETGAVNATIFAIIVIFLYIFIRFRDWRYSLGTIVALLHDVLVTLIVSRLPAPSFLPDGNRPALYRGRADRDRFR